MVWHDADDDLDDAEFPDDPDDGEDDDTLPCPHCGEPIYDDAERCPECGRYLSREDLPWRKPAWLVVGVVAGLAAVAWCATWTWRR